jgi:multidrug resistance efflux pump
VDPQPFQAVDDEANARLNVARAELTQANSDLDAAKAETEPAQAAQLTTQLDVKRYVPSSRTSLILHRWRRGKASLVTLVPP